MKLITNSKYFMEKNPLNKSFKENPDDLHDTQARYEALDKGETSH